MSYDLKKEPEFGKNDLGRIGKSFISPKVRMSSESVRLTFDLNHSMYRDPPFAVLVQDLELKLSFPSSFC